MQKRKHSQVASDMEPASRCKLCLRSIPKASAPPTVEREFNLRAILYPLIGRNETWDEVCSICNNILDIILDFRTAALQANDVLRAGNNKIDCTNNWPSDQLLIASRCRDMVRAHLKQIKTIFKEQRAKQDHAALGKEYDSLTVLNVIKTDIKNENEITASSISEDDPPLTGFAPKDTSTETAHRRGRKPKDQPEFMPQLCDFCGKRVCGEAAEGHKNQHLGIRPYPCPVAGCSLVFHGRYNRLRHVKRMHGETGVEVHACHLCGKTIRGPRRALKYHLQRHEQNQRAEKAFLCQICGKGFALQRYLAQHSVVHSGEFPHKCGYCHKKFNNKWGMRTHEKNIHEKRNHVPLDFGQNTKAK